MRTAVWIGLVAIGALSPAACDRSSSGPPRSDTAQVTEPAPPMRPPTPLQNFSAPFYFGGFSIPADNPLTEEVVALGQALFFDTALSIDNTVSCSTCHRPELAFTDGRALSVGVGGAVSDRSAMSLVNLLWGPQRFFWDGRAASLEAQALEPIENPKEMGESLPNVIAKLTRHPDYPGRFAAAFGSPEVTAARVGKALASFERTLISANSRYDRYLRGEISLSKQEMLGKQLFQTHPDPKVSLRGTNCGDCHSALLTSGFATAYDGFSNNGLDREEDLSAGLTAVTGKSQDRGKFKVPSLRNIAVTAPYMHDGRFQTLNEVLDHYDQHIRESATLDPLIREASNLPFVAGRAPELNMTQEEKEAVIAFLHTLTDESFLANPEWTTDGSSSTLARSPVEHNPPHERPPRRPAPSVIVSFTAKVGDEPYPGPATYANPAGAGRFRIEDFKMYVSNLVLKDSRTGETHAEPDSYHLLYFADSQRFEIALAGVPPGSFDTMELGIGIDPVQNRSITTPGDLDPNSQMAWSWTVGYKFVLLEGTHFPSAPSESPSSSVPLVYHIGFSENYRTLVFDLNAPLIVTSDMQTRVDLVVQLANLFRGAHAIDMNQTPSIKFERAAARSMADNLSGVLRLAERSPGKSDRD